MSQSRAAVSSLIAVMVVLANSACTRSFDYVYKSEIQRLPAAERLANVTVGVARFEDKRSWIQVDSGKAQSFIAQQGTWKFGLTHKGADYTPVNEIVQDIFVSEFNNAGIKTKPIAQTLAKRNAKEIRSNGVKSGVNYVLGGEILVFEFVNETGMWTVSTRRSVTISASLHHVVSDNVVVDNNFSESQRENEGMGVLHSTNVEKLMNGVLKTIIRQVIEQTAAKVALSPADVKLHLFYGEKAYEFAWGQDDVVVRTVHIL